MRHDGAAEDRASLGQLRHRAYQGLRAARRSIHSSASFRRLLVRRASVKLARMQSNYILPLLAFTALASANLLSAAEPGYAPPASPRITYSFNSDWKFIRQDVPGAQAVTFDDS